MFRCDWCEDYKDKSEAEENPLDKCSSICWDCKSDYMEVHPPERVETKAFIDFCNNQYNELTIRNYS